MSDGSPAANAAFHARLQEVEPGLFRAEYRGELNPDQADSREFPDFHLGSSADGVKMWVEQMARAMGYQRVVWDALPPGM